MERVWKNGDALLTGTTWKGRRCMRLSVCSWRTTGEDVKRTVAGVERALTQLAAEGS